MKRYAAIDIGTNTILMVVAELLDNGHINVLADEHHIARLGENLNRTGIISDAALGRASKILGKYSEICSKLQVDIIDAVGTSALRDAVNHEIASKILGDKIGHKIKIISGEKEAYLSFIGTIEDNHQSLVIDIGGGSTEFILGSSESIDFRKSMNIGAVRLTEKYIDKHPPNENSLNQLKKTVQQSLDEHLPDDLVFDKIYAVAGTPTTIAAIAIGLLDDSHENVHGYILKIDDLKNILNLFIENHVDYLINNLFIHPKRADVITAGTVILIESLKHLKKDTCIVSSKGLRYGVLKSMINNSL